MKTISRDELNKTITIDGILGYACPRCKLETWATNNGKVEQGYCYACAFSGEPLKIKEVK